MLLKLYAISADGGNSWTEQWLTDAEVREAIEDGYSVKKV